MPDTELLLQAVERLRDDVRDGSKQQRKGHDELGGKLDELIVLHRTDAELRKQTWDFQRTQVEAQAALAERAAKAQTEAVQAKQAWVRSLLTPQTVALAAVLLVGSCGGQVAGQALTRWMASVQPAAGATDP